MADYRQMAADAARRYGIPVDLFLAQITRESAWRPSVVSDAGAIGLGQLMPGTAKELGVDPLDPAQNLEGSARYLSQQYKKFGDWETALAAYNAGPGAVSKYGGVPPYKETQNYVRTILGNVGRGTDVAADTMAALGKGGGTVTPDQIAQGAMAQSAGQEPEQPRGLLGNLFGNPDTMAALAMAFNSMRLNPDPNLSAVLSAQMKERRGERKATAQLNKTLAYLEKAAAAGDPRAVAALDYAKGTGDIANALKIATEKAPKASEAEQKINRLMIDYGVDRKTAVGIVDGVVVVNRDPVTGQAQLVNKVTGDVVGSPSGGTGQITETALPPVEASDTFADTNVSGALGARGFGASVLNTVTDAVGLGQWADETGKAQQALQNLSARTMLGLSAEFPGRPSNLTRERIEAMTVMPGEITTGPDKALNKTREMRKLLEQSYAAASSAASGQGRYSPTQVAEARQNIGQIESLLADYIALEEALTKGLGGSQPSAQTGGGTSGSVSINGKNIPWKIKEQ